MMIPGIMAQRRQAPVEIPTAGLIAHYTMDNISGSTLVSETGLHNGAIAGCVPVAGKFGNALNFDGSGDFVDIPHSADFNGDLTISFWLKAGFSAINLRGLFYKAQDTGLTLSFGSTINTSGKIVWSTSNGSSLAQSFSTTTMDGSVARHVTLAVQGNTNRVYVGGVQEGTATLTGSRVTSPVAVTIGRVSLDSTSSRYLLGWIDQVRIYNRALTQPEIAVLAAEV